MKHTFCIETINLARSLGEIISLADQGAFEIIKITSEGTPTPIQHIMLAFESDLDGPELHSCFARLKHSHDLGEIGGEIAEEDTFVRTTMAYEY